MPPYKKKLQTLISAFKKNLIFGKNRDPWDKKVQNSGCDPDFDQTAEMVQKESWNCLPEIASNSDLIKFMGSPKKQALRYLPANNQCLFSEKQDMVIG